MDLEQKKTTAQPCYSFLIIILFFSGSGQQRGEDTNANNKDIETYSRLFARQEHQKKSPFILLTTTEYNFWCFSAN